MAYRRNNSFPAHAIVHDPMVCPERGVRNHRMMEEARDMIAWHRMPPYMIIAKIMRGNEAKASPSQPKTKIGRARPALEAEASSNSEARSRRQRRPTAIIISRAPAHPGRPPDIIRTPAPSQARVPEPATIMKCRPAPGIIRFPIPAAIGVDPSSPIEVRLPIRIETDDCGLQAPAISIDVHPRSVRSE